ncbi:Tad domain-containing protein [Motilimonas cestriensis]|uniref:Tad domain-containing protein n=1 Tax=Motilimonas cestriensis TaxID=2742685 RepID=UPI003DA42738
MIKIQKQQGNIVAFVALFLIAMSLGSFAIYDSGVQSKERIRLQNTVDAGAYTAAVLQSRELNFHAYMNRGMAANHVTVAQMVSITSYLQSNQQVFSTLETLGDWLQWIPYIGPFLERATSIAEQAFSYINEYSHIGADYAVGLIEPLNLVLSGASEAYHYAALLGYLTDVSDVIDKNDPNAKSFLAGGTLTALDIMRWNQFLRQFEVDTAEKGYSSNSGTNREHKTKLDEYRDVVLKSRDDFSSNRHGKHFEINLGFPIGKTRFEQRGGSEMGRVENKDAPYYSFSAYDTMSLWADIFSCRRWSCKYRDRERATLGWDRQATHHKDEDFDWSRPVKDRNTNLNQYWGNARHNRSSFNNSSYRDNWGYMEWNGTIAHNKDVKGNGLGKAINGYQGLKDFYDIKDSGLIKTAQPIRILVAKDDSDMDLTHNKNLATGKAELTANANDSMLNARMVAMSKAEAYFSRPHDLWARRDGKIEFGNMYNPYWQPRLSEISNWDRVQASIAGGF